MECKGQKMRQNVIDHFDLGVTATTLPNIQQDRAQQLPDMEGGRMVMSWNINMNTLDGRRRKL